MCCIRRMVVTHTHEISTKGQGDAHDVTGAVGHAVVSSGLRAASGQGGVTPHGVLLSAADSPLRKSISTCASSVAMPKLPFILKLLAVWKHQAAAPPCFAFVAAKVKPFAVSQS